MDELIVWGQICLGHSSEPCIQLCIYERHLVNTTQRSVFGRNSSYCFHHYSNLCVFKVTNKTTLDLCCLLYCCRAVEGGVATILTDTEGAVRRWLIADMTDTLMRAKTIDTATVKTDVSVVSALVDV